MGYVIMGAAIMLVGIMVGAALAGIRVRNED